MRDFLDAILSFIGAASLTNDEFTSLTVTVPEYSVANYTALLSVLDAREMVTNTRDKLRYFFLAKGVAVGEAATASKSNIFLGGPVCS